MAIPNLSAQTMMAMFTASEDKTGYLSSFFKPVGRSTGTYGNSLLWDIKRFDRNIAGTIDANTGHNLNSASVFSTKELFLPDFGEAMPINAKDLINRISGEDPFSASSRPFMSRFIEVARDGLVQMAKKIDRTVELMSAQVLQTGTISLAGAAPFAASFFPKATHFPTVAIAWSNLSTSVPLDDVEGLANVVNTDSNKRIKKVIMGATALSEFLNSDQVKERADFRRMELIEIRPREFDARGASFQGTFIAGGYRLELWAYDGQYIPFGGGAEVPYVDDNKVILLPDDPGLVVGSLKVAQIVGPDPRVSHLLTVPTKSEGGWDLTPNIWCNNQGNVVYAGFEARPVMIPQGIDEYGALTT